MHDNSDNFSRNSVKPRRNLRQLFQNSGEVLYLSQWMERSLVFTLYQPAIRLLLLINETSVHFSHFPNQPAKRMISENVSRTNPRALAPHMLFLLLHDSLPLLGEDETEEMEAPRRRGCLVIANCVLNSPLSSQVQHTGEPSSLKKEAMLKHRGRNNKREEEQGRQTHSSVN